MGTGAIACLTCRQSVARTRGCCDRCYNRHRRAVTNGVTTWVELEGRGLVAPAQLVGHAWRGWSIGRPVLAKQAPSGPAPKGDIRAAPGRRAGADGEETAQPEGEGQSMKQH